MAIVRRCIVVPPTSTGRSALVASPDLAMRWAIDVTVADGDNIMGAMQMGNPYFQVTREFGELVRAKIDAFVLPAGRG